ncbi:MAG: response regulator [Pyrinomonadaceae bacterium]
MQTARREDKTNSILLVIEPDAATRLGMKRLLEMKGYEVTAVANEREAALIAAKENYDLILFDSYLPPPASFSAAHKLYQHTELENTPILVISVHGDLDIPLSDPDVDRFTIAFITNLEDFEGLERLTASLLLVGNTKKTAARARFPRADS